MGGLGPRCFSFLARSLQSQLAFRKRLGALGTASSVMEREPFSSERQETQQVEENRVGLFLVPVVCYSVCLKYR